jgi:hypothetical protein
MKDEAIATIPKGMEGMMTLDRPEGHDEGTLGSEGIGRDNIRMPRIDIAQKMSPEIDPTNAEKRIEGLEFTDLYHSESKKKLGKGPLHFVILRRDEPRWIEWNPREQGGGIKDKNVRAGDPRTKFGPNGEKPIAVEYNDFVCLWLTGLDFSKPLESIAALSLKSSGIAAAQQLNFLITLRGPKLICKGVYSLTTDHKTDKKTQGVYAIYKFAQAGWLKPDSPIEKLAIEMFEAWKDRKVTFDDDPDSFEPADIERQAAGAAHTDM